VDYLINDQEKTPKGLLFLDMWGTLGLAANSALIMLQVNTHYVFGICTYSVLLMA
jgi:hypothetical protein